MSIKTKTNIQKHRAINTNAISIFTYSIGVINWTITTENIDLDKINTVTNLGVTFDGNVPTLIS